MNFSTCAQRVNYPIHQGKPNPAHGKFFLVGSIPANCIEQTGPRAGRSMFWDSEVEALLQAVEGGAIQLQREDCSFATPDEIRAEARAAVPREPAEVHTVRVSFPLTTAFLQDVMTTAVESAYDWFRFRCVVRLPDDAGDQENCVVSFDAIEVDENGGGALSTARIDAAKIAHAIGVMLAGGKAYAEVVATLASACVENDASNVDADVADRILQVACFDEVRYG